VYILDELPPDTPHLNSGNRICYRASGDTRTQNRWDPGMDTLAMVALAAQRWCIAFLVWLSLRRWPVKDAKED